MNIPILTDDLNVYFEVSDFIGYYKPFFDNIHLKWGIATPLFFIRMQNRFLVLLVYHLQQCQMCEQHLAGNIQCR